MQRLLPIVLQASLALIDDSPWQALRQSLLEGRGDTVFQQAVRLQIDLEDRPAIAVQRAQQLLAGRPADGAEWTVEDWLIALPVVLAVNAVIEESRIGGRSPRSLPAGPVLAETATHYLIRRGPLTRPQRGGRLVPDSPDGLLVGAVPIRKRLGGAFIGLQSPRVGGVSDPPTTITIVPALETPQDVVIREVAPSSARAHAGFAVEAMADPARIVKTTLKALSRGTWVVLPEGSVSPATLTALMQGLATRGANTGLVFAGTGCHDGYNRAHVLGPSGRILWQQTKMRLWHVDDQTRLTAWFGHPPNHPLPYQEATNIGETIIIVDLPKAGRILIAICEDLERDTAPLRDVIRLSRPDWIISPVFDTGTGIDRWSGRRARDHAIGGATTIVATPAALTRLERPGDTKITVGLITLPSGDQRPLSTQDFACGSGITVVAHLPR